jgi:phosphatidylinositol 4-kinase A
LYVHRGSACISPSSRYASVVAVVTQAYPALHGLYRALVSTPFNWTVTNWLHLSDAISVLLEADAVDRLNNLVGDVVQLDDANSYLPQTVLGRYVSKERPLSGYFAVCCIMEIQWTVLAQTLVSSPEEKTQAITLVGGVEDAAAANAAWNALVSKKVTIAEQYKQPVLDGLKQTLDRAMDCFTDLLAQMGELDGEPSMDTYAWETMAECLVRLDSSNLSHLTVVTPENSIRLLHCSAEFGCSPVLQAQAPVE